MIEEQAFFIVMVNGTDVSTVFASDLIQMTIHECSGKTTDSATVELDDTEGHLVFPVKGAEVYLAIGWKDGQGGMAEFNGQVDEVTSTGNRGGGMRMSISCKSAPVKGKIKSPREKHAKQKSLKDVASQWGQDAGLQVTVAGELASITRPWWGMMNESFPAWAKRTAEEVGATFKILGKKAVFVPMSSGMSASGKALTPILAQRPGNLISWSVKPDIARPEHKKFKTRHFDRKTSKWKVETETPDYQTDSDAEGCEQFAEANEDNAKHKSKHRAKHSKRNKGDGTIEIDGAPEAQAEAPVIIIGARPGIDGQYTADTVEHSFERGGGFKTSITLKAPNAGKDGR